MTRPEGFQPDLEGEFERGLSSEAFRLWFQRRLREGRYSQQELFAMLFPEWQDRPVKDPEATLD